MRTIHMTVRGDAVTLDSAVAGVQGSGNVDKLVVRFDESWAGYAKSVCWWDAHGLRAGEPRLLTAELLVDGGDERIYILLTPPEALRWPGQCTLVIDGWKDGCLARTVRQELQVVSAPAAAKSGDVTPSQAQQLQSEIEHMVSVMRRTQDDVRHGPVIGPMDTWLVWDTDAQEYGDTGVSVNGKAGPTGLQGPKGDPGQNGRDGKDGKPGPQGEPGPAGERGSCIWKTAGPPGEGLGNQGDWAIDPATGDLYYCGRGPIPLDESNATWNDFMNAAWEYAQNWDNGPMDDILGVYDESLLNNDFLLRKSMDETDVFASTGQLYDSTWGDKLYNVITMFFMSSRVSDFSSDSYTFDKAIPTWEEFQYVLIHYEDIVTSGNILPSLEAIRSEAQEKYTWRYKGSSWWIRIGNLKGPKGDKGDRGPAGEVSA